jgi:hypothetical protein
MNDNSDEIKALEAEREELNLLIKRGVKFNVTTKTRRREKGLRGFFSRPEVVEETHNFEIHEPTLSTLDRLSEYSLAMAIDEEAIKSEGRTVIGQAKQLAKDNAERMARAIAIAVLGEDYYVTEVNRFGRVNHYNNDKELDRLTALFFHSLKPSKLVSLSAIVTNVSNLGDFTTSMRYLSGARTALPRKERIE